MSSNLSRLTRTIITSVFTCLILLPYTRIYADADAPVVRIRYGNDIQKDGSWVLGVKATDNVGVTETTVYYRTRAQKEFTAVNSAPKSDYRWLSHFVGYKPTTVYFYVESSDAAGNITSRGSAKKPLTVKVAPVSNSTKPAPKASNTVTKKKDGSIDYGENCVPANAWKRLSVNSSHTRKTKSRNGKQIPNGRSKRMSLSGGKHYFYSVWRNLRIRTYNFDTRLIDANGNVAYRGKIQVKSTTTGAENNTWTTWDTYVPKKGDPTGVWRYIVCGEGRLQVNMKFSVVE